MRVFTFSKFKGIMDHNTAAVEFSDAAVQELHCRRWSSWHFITSSLFLFFLLQ